MDDKEFEVLINKALDKLPKEFFEKLSNVTILIRDWPTEEQAMKFTKRGENRLLLGLYEGVPQTKRGNYGVGGPLPDKITIFKTPLLIISKSDPDIEENVKDTVIHEIAHHFGISDAEISKIKHNGQKGGDKNERI